MGNCTAVPTLRRTPHISRSQSRRDTVSFITNGAQVSVLRSEPYIVHHNVPSPVESPIWVAIKNRRRHRPHTNRIKTTRYNILTFIPKNLFEQFRRVANIYFAILIGLNWIPIINAISKTVHEFCIFHRQKSSSCVNCFSGCFHSSRSHSRNHGYQRSRRRSQTLEK